MNNVFKKIEYNSPVVLTFALISLAVLILNKVTGGFMNLRLFSVYHSSPISLFFWVRLVGHVLGHADWSHYAGNILMLLLLGPILEEKYGSKDLITMILIVAVITGVVNIVFFPQSRLLGASGVVFMMIIMASTTGMQRGKIPLTLIIVATLYLGQEVVSGIMIADNISRLSHVLGGICGGGFGLLLNKNK